VATLAREDLSPEAALARLERDAAAAAAWRTGDGALADHVGRLAAVLAGDTAPPLMSFSDAMAGWHLAARSVPEGGMRPAAPDEALRAADAEWVAAAWPAHGRTIRRYLAAKAFASWCAVQGDGLLTAVSFLSLALATLRVEAARAAAGSKRPLDAPALKDAVRASDLLLVHLAAPEALAAALSRPARLTP
jgi:hypothetical protein